MTQGATSVAAVLADATSRLAAAGSESARLDAELLLGYVLGIERTALLAHPDAPVGTGQLESFESLVERRASGEPVAYIRGFKEFYGTAIVVDERVLIPRPESETLVELALERVAHDMTATPRSRDAEPYLVWDMGTGSGAIAIAIAVELRRRGYGDAVRFHVSDVSEDALAVAVVNAASHGVADLMVFASGDLTQVEPSPAGAVDLLVANLPYVPSATIPGLPVAASFEPRVALDGGEDGLDPIRRLLPRLDGVLAVTGAALLEIGTDQAEALRVAIASDLPDWTATIKDDLGGDPRVAQLERPGA